MDNGSNPILEQIDLRMYSSCLFQGSDHIWFSSRRAAVSYPEEGNQNCLSLEKDSFWFAHRSRCIEALVRRFLPPGPIFDIGGGNGYVSIGLERAGFPSVLVEPGPQGVRNALERGVRSLVCASLEDAAFNTGSLPAVGLFDVLEHIKDEAGFLKNLHEMLVPGGRMYLTVPAHLMLWSADDDYAGHQRRYSLSALRETLELAGLQVEYASYMFFVLPLPIFLVRAIPSRLGMRKQSEWDRYQEEHGQQPGFIGNLLNGLLDLELKWIRQGRSIPVGASCIAVARRPV